MFCLPPLSCRSWGIFAFPECPDIILRDPDQPRDPRPRDQHHQDGLCCAGEFPERNADDDVPAQQADDVILQQRLSSFPRLQAEFTLW